MGIAAFCSNTLDKLQAPIDNDPITRCGDDIVRKVAADPKETLKLADEKLHVFPFKDVDSCWRRLYTDAGITRALKLIIEYEEGKHIGENEEKVSISNGARHKASQDEKEKEEDQWLEEVIKQLDMVLIMTGAPLREDMISTIFQQLQTLLDEAKAEFPPTKRRKTVDKFLDSPSTPLPKLSHPIPKSSLSLAEFSSHLSSTPPTPKAITSSLTHWPALTTRPWSSPSYLLKQTLNGRRLVPVELGRSYTDPDWGQAILPFRDFLDKYILSPSTPSGSPQTEGTEKAKEEKIGYLAQHDLLSQIPSLRNDIAIPDFCFTDPPGPQKGEPLYEKIKGQKKLEDPLINVWFGSKGTISPLHTDPYHNVLCQVVGRKYVRLYKPGEGGMYPRGMEGVEGREVDMSNTSGVPVERVEGIWEGKGGGKGEGEGVGEDEEGDGEGDFPLFDKAEYVETILEEGEALYIPVGWWHYVMALTVSFNVSFWWN